MEESLKQLEFKQIGVDGHSKYRLWCGFQERRRKEAGVLVAFVS